MARSLANSEFQPQFHDFPELAVHTGPTRKMLSMSRKSLKIAGVLTLLFATIIGCGGDPNANTPEITPELKEKIRQEDAAVDAAEGADRAPVKNN